MHSFSYDNQVFKFSGVTVLARALDVPETQAK